MIAYKFLRDGAVGLFTGHQWPVPVGGDPGPWIEAPGPLTLCLNGIHACEADGLAEWIDDELWVIELDGEVEEQEGVVVATRGRLLRRVEEWVPATARSFASDCVLRARDRAAASLEAGGDRDAALRLAETDVQEAQAYARSLAIAGTSASEATLHLFADTVELVEGRRPDGLAATAEGVAEPPTEGAIAANLGYVVAHVCGTAAADISGRPGDYEPAFAAERARQNAWLRDRLSLA